MTNVLTDLKNKFLIATADLNGTVFERSVVYVCSHSEEGAMGVVVNRPLESVAFTDIAKSLNVEPLIQKRQPIIYNGGPVERHRGFVVHTADYKNKDSFSVSGDIMFSTTSDIVADIAHGIGPTDVTFCLGYAGWGESQLEDELKAGSWLVLEGDAHTLFDTPAQEKYDYCTQKLGLNALNYAGRVVGIA